jgi:hypothetical protein
LGGPRDESSTFYVRVQDGWTKHSNAVVALTGVEVRDRSFEPCDRSYGIADCTERYIHVPDALLDKYIRQKRWIIEKYEPQP